MAMAMDITVTTVSTDNTDIAVTYAEAREFDSEKFQGVAYSERGAIADLLRQIAEDLEATQVKADVAAQTQRNDEAVKLAADNFKNNIDGGIQNA